MADVTENAQRLMRMNGYYVAIRAGDAEKLEDLLKTETEDTFERVCRDPKNLFHVISYDDARTLGVMLRHGKMNLDAREKDLKYTALFAAARQNNLEIVQMLLAAGANPDIRDDRGMTPLMSAAAGGRAEVARALVNGLADIGLKNNAGATAHDIARRCLDNAEIMDLDFNTREEIVDLLEDAPAQQARMRLLRAEALSMTQQRDAHARAVVQQNRLKAQRPRSLRIGGA